MTLLFLNVALVISGIATALYSVVTGEWRWLLVTVASFALIRGGLKA